MPEGPSIVILKELTSQFKGQVIREIGGNTKVDVAPLAGKKVKAIKSWGKHFLIELDKVSIRIHFLLFGSYSINERKAKPERLYLEFDNGFMIFYACSVKLIDIPLNKV